MILREHLDDPVQRTREQLENGILAEINAEGRCQPNKVRTNKVRLTEERQLRPVSDEREN
jgi:hypothetical protein